MGILDSLGSLASGAASLLSLPYQIFASERQHKTQTDQFNTQMNFARESRDLMMQREDNAMQRRVADMEAAGLHKSLAVGGGAAGAGSVPTPGAGSVPSPSNVAPSVANLMEFALKSKELNIQEQLANAQSNKLNADADESHIRSGYYERHMQVSEGHLRLAQSQFFINLGHLGVAQSQERRLSGADARAAETHKIELQRLGLEVDLLKDNLKRRPEEFRGLILDNLRKSHQVEGAALDNLQTLGDLRLQSFREESHRLQVASQTLGISRQELENSILAHDAEVFLSSGLPSNARGRDANIRNYLMTLIPGNSSQATQARKILQPVLSTYQYVLKTSYGVLKDTANVLR